MRMPASRTHFNEAFEGGGHIGSQLRRSIDFGIRLTGGGEGFADDADAAELSACMRVMPLSYLSKIGIMTTSLMTSHISISPAREIGDFPADCGRDWVSMIRFHR